MMAEHPIEGMMGVTMEKISGGNVRTIQLVEHVSPVDSAINALPDLVDRISALIKKDKPETPQE